MISKIYEKIKKFMIDNKLTLLFYLVFIVVMTYKLPFYIYTGGGVIDTSKRVYVENAYKKDGKFYFAYVSSLNATIPTFLLAQIIPNWDIESTLDYKIDDEESSEDIFKRDKLYLEEANTAAIFNAYNLSGKKIDIIKENLSVIYVSNKEMSELKVGDVIRKINDVNVYGFDDIKNIVNEHKKDDVLKIEIERNDKTIIANSTIYENDNVKMIGISVLKTYDYELDPKLELKFKSSEAGPSGGLALALTIYNSLVSEDITTGKKIVTTGTIDMHGNVGAIGGVIYKLRGALKEKADIFIVPNEDNYEEVMEVVRNEKLDIQIIGVDTFQDAIVKLSKIN